MILDYLKNGATLVKACARGDVALADACLAAGADVHFKDDLPLRAAAMSGQTAMVRFLAAKGADIHACGEEALLYAGKRNEPEMIRFFLDQGADIARMRQRHGDEVTEACLDAIDAVQSDEAAQVFALRHQAMKNGLKKDYKKAFKP